MDTLPEIPLHDTDRELPLSEELARRLREFEE